MSVKTKIMSFLGFKNNEGIRPIITMVSSSENARVEKSTFEISRIKRLRMKRKEKEKQDKKLMLNGQRLRKSFSGLEKFNTTENVMSIRETGFPVTYREAGKYLY